MTDQIGTDRATKPVANKVISWLVLLFGIAEVPWVIFLLFTQQTTVAANHLRLAGAGVALGGAVLCFGAAWAIWKLRPSVIIFCVSAVTLTVFLGVTATLSPNLQADGLATQAQPIVMAIFAAVVGVSAIAIFFNGTQASRRTLLAVAAIVLLIVGLFYLGHMVSHAMSDQTTGWMDRTRAIVVILDTFESIGLIGAGVASLKGHVKATLVFSVMGATLLSCDAYANVVGATQGPAFWAAIFYLIVGEIPSIVLLVLVARSAQRAWTSGGGSERVDPVSA